MDAQRLLSSEEATTSAWNSPTEYSNKALWWTFAAVSLPVAGAVIWWCTEKSFNSLAPHEVLLFASATKPSCQLLALPPIKNRYPPCSTNTGRAPFRDSYPSCWTRMPRSAEVTWVFHCAVTPELWPAAHTATLHREGAHTCVHGRLLRYDALWPRQCASAGT